MPSVAEVQSKKYIIALSSYSCTGKSTLIKDLNKRMNIAISYIEDTVNISLNERNIITFPESVQPVMISLKNLNIKNNFLENIINAKINKDTLQTSHGFEIFKVRQSLFLQESYIMLFTLLKIIYSNNHDSNDTVFIFDRLFFDNIVFEFIGAYYHYLSNYEVHDNEPTLATINNIDSKYKIIDTAVDLFIKIKELFGIDNNIILRFFEDLKILFMDKTTDDNIIEKCLSKGNNREMLDRNNFESDATIFAILLPIIASLFMKRLSKTLGFKEQITPSPLTFAISYIDYINGNYDETFEF